MAIANVTLNNTFDEWRTITNQTVTFVNEVDTQQLINAVSNSVVLSVSARNIKRNDTLYLTINVSSDFLDSSNLNVATANVVNTAFLFIKNTDSRLVLVSNDANTINAVANAAIIQANTSRVHANAAHASANAGMAIGNAAFAQANTARIHANLAFAHANAAFTNANTVMVSAQSAFTQANIAFANANTVMISAQAAFTVANSGFLHANASFLQANTVRIHANVSFAQANTARDHANAAFLQANTSFDQANTARIHANVSFAQGNTAYNHANIVFVQANTARIHANVSFEQANTSRDHANASFGQANTARIHANNAFEKANIAYDTAVAVSGCTAPIIEANKAGFDHANNAYDQANTARVHANTAHASANAGLLQANTARDHANAAFLQANSGGLGLIQANTARDHANAAFLQANAALPNVSGVSFAGNLQMPTGNLAIGTGATQGVPFYISRRDAIANIFPEITTFAGSQFTRYNSNTSFGAWSDLTIDRDHTIIFSNGSPDDGANLVIGPWTDSSFGYKQDGAGRHGFNTSNPRHVLDANGSANISGALTVAGTLSIGSAANANVYISDGTTALAMGVWPTDAWIGTTTSDAFFIRTSDVDRVRIGSTGGMTSYGSYEISVNATNADFYLNSIGGSGKRWLFSSGTSGNFTFYDSTASNTRMILSSSGNARFYTANGNQTHAMDYSNLGGRFTLYDDTGSSATRLEEQLNATRLLQLIEGSDMYIGFGSSTVATGNLMFMRPGYNEAARIDSTGNLLIGCTNSTVGSAVKLDIFGAANVANILVNGRMGLTTQNYNSYSPTLTGTGASGSWGISVTGSAATFTSTTQNSQFNSLGVGIAASGTAGEIRATNEVTAYYSSDENLKTNIVPIENALGKLKMITGVMFDWTDDEIERRGGEDGYFVRKHDTGVIAQDVEKVLPEVVATREDGYKAVKYEKLAGLIIQAINELHDEVEKLKSK